MSNIKFTDVVNHCANTGTVTPEQLEAMEYWDGFLQNLYQAGGDCAEAVELGHTQTSQLWRAQPSQPAPVAGGVSPFMDITYEESLAIISSGFRPAERPNHNGVDYAVATGTELASILGGKVTIADGTTDPGGYGNLIQIQGRDAQGRPISVAYAHLDSFGVLVGGFVEVGQYIGKSGNTGRSSGPHLHLEVAIINPSTGAIVEYLNPVTWMAEQTTPAPDEPEDGPAPQSAYDRTMEFILRWEGGLSDDPADPAAAGLLPGEVYHTNQGVTQTTYSTYLQGKGLQPAPVRLMADDERDEIYREMYWDPAGCAAFDFPLACEQMDLAVLAGHVTAIQWLQRELGVDDDGKIGPVTLEAVASANHLTLANGVLDNRISYVSALPQNHPHRAGWLNRLNSLLEYIN